MQEISELFATTDRAVRQFLDERVCPRCDDAQPITLWRSPRHGVVYECAHCGKRWTATPERTTPREETNDA